MSYVRKEASTAHVREEVMPFVVHCYSILDQVKKSIYIGDLKKANRQVSNCIDQLDIVQDTIKIVGHKSNILAMTRLSPKIRKYKNNLRKQIKKGRLIIKELDTNK